jgi:halogenation protein CepH
MRNSREYDVAVVGGGPAGSTAATLIAMQGHRVVLLEKEQFPFYKIGESLLPATIHGICPMLGIPNSVFEANFVRKRGGTFVWGRDPEPWTFDFSGSSRVSGPTSTAYQVERMKFDHILLCNAREKGVDVRERHAVTELVMENERVTGIRVTNPGGQEQVVTAQYVIDASGHNTNFAKHHGERIHSKFFQNIALFGYYTGGKRMPAPNQGNILCVAFGEGWFWYIPLSAELTSVGVVFGREHAAVLQAGWREAMNAFIEKCPRIQDMLRSAVPVAEGPYGELRVRKDYSYQHSKFWSPGLVLVGDAACFVDPVFSSGVHLATYSGLLAARSINTCMGGAIDEERCFSEFENRYRREYALFYDFLLAFYDTHQDLSSYFWQARKITHSAEAENTAFIDLVAGLSNSGERLYQDPEEFMAQRRELPTALFSQARERSSEENQWAGFMEDLVHEAVQVQTQATLKDRRAAEMPLFPDGLVASADGLHWTESEPVAV